MISCPKCASSEGRSIEAIYCECQSVEMWSPPEREHLAVQSAPPEPQHTALWMVVTALCALLCAGSASFRDGSSLAFAACTLLSGVMTQQAIRYNRRDFPRLLDHWHKSLMCTRCGEVYVPA